MARFTTLQIQNIRTALEKAFVEALTKEGVEVTETGGGLHGDGCDSSFTLKWPDGSITNGSVDGFFDLGD